MKKFIGVSLVLVLLGAIAGWMVWHDFGRAIDIPLIDRDDPTYATALARIERSMMSLVGRINQPVDRLTGRELVLIQQLARARLSQTIYEAKIARTEVGPDSTVTITIPSYAHAGSKLESYLVRELLRNTSDQDLRRRLRVHFMHFGAGKQTLSISVLPPDTGGSPDRLYQITHHLDGPFGSLVGRSGLSALQLGVYSPFVGAFPAI